MKANRKQEQKHAITKYCCWIIEELTGTNEPYMVDLWRRNLNTAIDDYIKTTTETKK